METLVADQKSAILYRMVLPDHVCPFGVRAKEMLETAGSAVDDRILSTREEVDAFKADQGVETTPQVSSMVNGSAAATICSGISAHDRRPHAARDWAFARRRSDDRCWCHGRERAGRSTQRP